MIKPETILEDFFSRHGLSTQVVLKQFQVQSLGDLTVKHLQTLAQDHGVHVGNLLTPISTPLEISLKSKAQGIRLVVLDVDGVMTDGGLYFTEGGDQIKKFNVKDGMGIQNLIQKNIEVAIISAGRSQRAIEDRAKMLGISHCFVSQAPKIEVLNRLCLDLKLSLDQVAMIGDDINDKVSLSQVGFSACPSDAVPSVQKIVHCVLNTPGGRGCVREFVDRFFDPSEKFC